MKYPNDYRAFLKANAWKDVLAKGHVTDQRKGIPIPPPQKPYPEDAVLTDLPAPGEPGIGDMTVREAIGQRRSRRGYTGEPLTLEELSFLLWATQGVRKVADVPTGQITFRTVPSGGARHEFETYLIVNRIDGVPPGLYRYLPMEHKLLFVRADERLPERIGTACCGQEFVGEGAVVFIWAAIPYRMEWRYSIVAHKVIAIDAGHVCQNLYIAAESIGAGTCAIGAYHQDEVDALVGLDGEEEFTVYLAPVGRVEAGAQE